MIHLREALARGRAYLAIICVVLAWPIITSVWHHAGESRVWRDLTRQTPFHSVTVTRSALTPRGAELSGEMVKRRCEYAGLSAYVQVGPAWKRAALDTSPEDASSPTGDRPSLPEAQMWGPWVVVWAAADTPAKWAIYAHHRCSEGMQINLFADGGWPG